MLPPLPCRTRGFVGAMVRACVVSASLLVAVAGGPSAPPAEVQRRTTEFEASRKSMAESPSDPLRVVDFARTAFDRSEVLPEGPVMEAVSEEAVEACRKALRARQTDARLHYYLGLNLGQLARNRTFSALRLIRQMESAWLTARTLDPGFDFAGADRSLGILYAECPRPPLGVGSREKARRHLSRAVELSPEHPENRLHLAEQLVRWGDREAARNQLDSLEALLPAARTRLAGPDWAQAWFDWDSRLQALRERLSTRP